jgi:exonuclease III
MEERKLKIATWNANGLLGKLQDLKVFLKMHDTDILTISETKLLNSDNVKIEGYNILRKQRDTNTRGGGVAIILKTDIPFTIVRLPATVFECTFLSERLTRADAPGTCFLLTSASVTTNSKTNS